MRSFVRSQQTFIPLISFQVAWPHISFAHFLFAFLIFLRSLRILPPLIQSRNILLLVLQQVWLEVLRLLLGELWLWLGELVSLALLFGPLALFVGVFEVLVFEVLEPL